MDTTFNSSSRGDSWPPLRSIAFALFPVWNLSKCFYHCRMSAQLLPSPFWCIYRLSTHLEQIFKLTAPRTRFTVTEKWKHWLSVQVPPSTLNWVKAVVRNRGFMSTPHCRSNVGVIYYAPWGNRHALACFHRSLTIFNQLYLFYFHFPTGTFARGHEHLHWKACAHRACAVTVDFPMHTAVCSS